MPYRIDVRLAGDEAIDRLIAVGALDVESSDSGIAAIVPDGVTPEQIARVLGVEHVTVSPAMGRDAGSVWVLSVRPFQIGRLRVLPADAEPEPGALRLSDSPAFGTGLHPTTALSLEALEETIEIAHPDSLLDVGTGSGVLALAALALGVPRAHGIDTDEDAIRAAAQNANLNGLDARLTLRCGGPDTLSGTWPLIVANVLAAPLLEMAPAIVRRVGHGGRLVLSGIPSSVEHEVTRAYRGVGMRRVGAKARGGWVAIVLEASW